MQTRNVVFAAVVAAALALGSATGYAASGAHQHEGAASGALKLNAGKKWQTDAPLRKGMTEIRAAVQADKAAIHAGKMTPARYNALAKKVESQVAYMVENCKLPPEADAQLHLIIADLSSGVDAMKGTDAKARRGGAEKIVAALSAYGTYFDHPGWRAPG